MNSDRSTDIALSDESLLAAANSEPHLFALLYDRYVGDVYRYCIRRLGEREASEDATSLIFEKAFVNLGQCPRQAFRPWLFTIAHNVVIDLHRKRRPESPIDTAVLIHDDGVGPEESALASETVQSVRSLLDSLSPDQRAVIELRLAGLNGTESMMVLGISRDVLGSRTYRAMAAMRSLLTSGEIAKPEATT